MRDVLGARSMAGLVLLAAAGLLAGCITTSSGDSRQSGAVTLSGVTTAPNQEIVFRYVQRLETVPAPGAEPAESEIQVPILCPNQACVQWVPLRTVSSSQPRRTPGGRPLGVYDWSVTIPDIARTVGSPALSFAASAWARQDPTARGLSTSVGRIEIAARPIVDGTVGPRLRTSVDGVNFEGDTFVAFDNDGVGPTAASPPAWTPDFEQPIAGLGITIQVGTYLVDAVTVGGVPDPVRAVMCHPTDRGSDPLRTVILNHGGLDVGIENADLTFCIQMAQRGWRVAMSAYRGGRIQRNATDVTDPVFQLPDFVDQPPTASASLSEFCLGEVTDVLRWTEVVRARTDTLDDQILMIGGSHGACVTLRAVEQGAQVRAAVALAPPVEMRIPYDLGVMTAMDPAAFIAFWAPRYGGGALGAPPGSLEARSPARMAVDLARRHDVHVLIASTIGDTDAPPAQGCLMGRLVSSTNFFLGPTGEFLDVDPPTTSCALLAGRWNHADRPLETGWPDERYFLLYQSGSHIPTSIFAPWEMAMDVPVESFIAANFGP